MEGWICRFWAEGLWHKKKSFLHKFTSCEDKVWPLNLPSANQGLALCVIWYCKRSLKIRGLLDPVSSIFVSNMF